MPKFRKNAKINDKNTPENVQNESATTISIEDSTERLQSKSPTPSPELTSLLQTTPENNNNSQYSNRITDEEDHNSNLEEPEVFCKRLLENLEIIKSIGVENNLIIPKLSKPSEQLKVQQFGRSKSENHILKIQGVNLNPYLKYDDLIIKDTKDKENSVNELSFFTPELLRAKHASTPINYNSKKNRSRILMNNSKNGNEHFSRAREKLDQIQSGKVSKLSQTAPAILSTPRRIDRSKCSKESVVQTSGTFKQFIERCRSTTGKWALSLISLCSNLGNTLKSSLCQKTSTNADIAQYRLEIERLNAKIEDLSANLIDIKTMLFQNIFEKNKNVEVNLENISNQLNLLFKNK